METTGFPHNLPYPDDTDPLSSWPQTLAALAEKVSDYLGGSGTTLITPAGVDENTGKRVGFGRTYGYVPRVFLQVKEPISTGTQVRVWPSDEDESGFTLNIRASNTTERTVSWLASP